MKTYCTVFAFCLLFVNPTFTNPQLWSLGEKDLAQTPPGNGFRGCPWGTSKGYIVKTIGTAWNDYGDGLRYLHLEVSTNFVCECYFYFDKKGKLVGGEYKNIFNYDEIPPTFGSPEKNYYQTKERKNSIYLLSLLGGIYGKPYKIVEGSEKQFLFKNRYNHVILTLNENSAPNNGKRNLIIDSVPSWDAKEKAIEKERKAVTKTRGL